MLGLFSSAWNILTYLVLTAIQYGNREVKKWG